jgi:hypothetical protein
MLLVTNPVVQKWAPATQIPTKVSVALAGFDKLSGRCILMATVLDQNGTKVNYDPKGLPQQPPQPTAAQIQAYVETPGVAGDTIDMAISRAAIALIQAIFGLTCTVVTD